MQTCDPFVRLTGLDTASTKHGRMVTQLFQEQQEFFPVEARPARNEISEQGVIRILGGMAREVMARDEQKAYKLHRCIDTKLQFRPRLRATETSLTADVWWNCMKSQPPLFVLNILKSKTNTELACRAVLADFPSWSLGLSAHVTQIAGNGEAAGDYLQQRINPYLVL